MLVWLFKKKVVILCALTVLQGLICRDIRHFADIYEAKQPLTGTIVSSVAAVSLANVVCQEGKSVCQPQPRAFYKVGSTYGLQLLVIILLLLQMIELLSHKGRRHRSICPRRDNTHDHNMVGLQAQKYQTAQCTRFDG